MEICRTVNPLPAGLAGDPSALSPGALRRRGPWAAAGIVAGILSASGPVAGSHARVAFLEQGPSKTPAYVTYL